MRRLFAGATIALWCATMVLGQSAVPAGFADEPFASGVTFPMALAFLPDGRLLCAEKDSGAILVFLPNGTSAPIGTVPDLNTAGSYGNHRGLQGIAVDPQWPARPYVYAYYTATTPLNRMRLEMFTVTGALANPTSTNLALTLPYQIVTQIPDEHEFHNGGTIAFGPDGNLYVLTGDDNDECLTQNLNTPAGKVLRINVAPLPQSGTGPPPVSLITPVGNPYTSPLPYGPLAWARGVRNPFRGDIDPVTGALFIADVGDNNWEEINLCTGPGMNFGWPGREGPTARPTNCANLPQTWTDPLVAHHHLNGASAIMSLAVYRNPPAPAPNAFGPGYEGDYFYSDFLDGKIRRLQHTGTTWTPATSVPGQPEPGVWAYTSPFETTDGAVGPDGALYYTQFTSGSIRRIRGGAPQGPTLTPSVPSASVLPVFAGVPVTFSLTATAQPGPGAAVTLSGTNLPATATIIPPLPASGPTVQFTFHWTPSYLETGRRDMRFTATDQTGMLRTCPLSVYVADSALVLSGAQAAPVPVKPGQDFILVNTTQAPLFLVAINAMPVFEIPNNPMLNGIHVYAQVARYNPALNPGDPLKLSNGLHIVIGGSATPYGQSSGLTLSGDPTWAPVIGNFTTLAVTQP